MNVARILGFALAINVAVMAVQAALTAEIPAANIAVSGNEWHNRGSLALTLTVTFAGYAILAMRPTTAPYAQALLVFLVGGSMAGLLALLIAGDAFFVVLPWTDILAGLVAAAAGTAMGLRITRSGPSRVAHEAGRRNGSRSP